MDQQSREQIQGCLAIIVETNQKKMGLIGQDAATTSRQASLEVAGRPGNIIDQDRIRIRARRGVTDRSYYCIIQFVEDGWITDGLDEQVAS